MDSQKEEHFTREYEMLSQLTLKKDKHLIRLLATYTFKNRYHFLFPYADHNLRSYWKAHVLEWKKEEVFWVLKQLLGLASALHVSLNFSVDYFFFRGVSDSLFVEDYNIFRSNLL